LRDATQTWAGWVAAAALTVICALASCSGGDCAKTCVGCCDSSGQCQAGHLNTACGAAGASCTSCTGVTTCQVGACVAPGGPDSGTPDAGPGPDAGPAGPDAGPGVPDGGSSDGGSTDAGPGVDAGATCPPTGNTNATSCAYQSCSPYHIGAPCTKGGGQCAQYTSHPPGCAAGNCLSCAIDLDTNPGPNPDENWCLFLFFCSTNDQCGPGACCNSAGSGTKVCLPLGCVTLPDGGVMADGGCPPPL